jgi:hypothetical protein
MRQEVYKYNVGQSNLEIYLYESIVEVSFN